ncbi:unnamed protein product [Scytosiphon promiscuus]
MDDDGDPEARSRRRVVAKLLVFAKELEKAGRISKASKGLLKELIVHENLQVISIGERLASSDGAQEHGVALDNLDEQIKKRASKSHQELFEICPLEQAHLLSQQDTEALAEGSDVKSLVYGEIDFRSFYDVIRAAVHGISNSRYSDGCPAASLTSLHAGRPSEAPAECQRRKTQDRDGGDEEEVEKKEDGRGRSGRVSVGDESETVGRRDRREASTPSCAEEEESEFAFYDLGSGSGRAVFAAVLAADFRCAVGIEVLGGVFRASTRIFKRYRKLVEPVLGSPAVIELLHGSFLDRACDWSDGDLVFANSTCFAEDTMLAIAARAELLRPGARVVTFTTALKTPWLRVLTKRRYQMSWGPATVFVHQKLSSQEHAERLRETTPFDEDQGIPQRTSTTGRSRNTTNENDSDGTHQGGASSSLLSPRATAAVDRPARFAPAWSLPSEVAGRRVEPAGSGGSGEVDDSFDASMIKLGSKDHGGGDEDPRRAWFVSSPQRPAHC